MRSVDYPTRSLFLERDLTVELFMSILHFVSSISYMLFKGHRYLNVYLVQHLVERKTNVTNTAFMGSSDGPISRVGKSFFRLW